MANHISHPSNTLIFACSGAADVGALADQTARLLNREGLGSMFCSVGIGGRIKGIMEKTQSASKILAIDGCPMDCMKHSLEHAGFHQYAHVRLTDHGFVKGDTVVNDSMIQKAKDIIVHVLKK